MQSPEIWFAKKLAKLRYKKLAYEQEGAISEGTKEEAPFIICPGDRNLAVRAGGGLLT